MDDTSGAAFPVLGERDSNGETIHEPELGLTKRELFAAMAMQGAMANQDYLNACANHAAALESSKLLAKACIGIADTLLAELAK